MCETHYSCTQKKNTPSIYKLQWWIISCCRQCVVYVLYTYMYVYKVIPTIPLLTFQSLNVLSFIHFTCPRIQNFLIPIFNHTHTVVRRKNADEKLHSPKSLLKKCVWWPNLVGFYRTLYMYVVYSICPKYTFKKKNLSSTPLLHSNENSHAFVAIFLEVAAPPAPSFKPFILFVNVYGPRNSTCISPEKPPPPLKEKNTHTYPQTHTYTQLDLFVPFEKLLFSTQAVIMCHFSQMITVWPQKKETNYLCVFFSKQSQFRNLISIFFLLDDFLRWDKCFFLYLWR